MICNLHPVVQDIVVAGVSDEGPLAALVRRLFTQVRTGDVKGRSIARSSLRCWSR